MADFKETVSKRIKKFTPEQRQFFAWLCAVRALPFLSTQPRRFGYWAEGIRQTYLFAVLNAVDHSIYGAQHKWALRGVEAAYAAAKAASVAYAADAAASAADAATYAADANAANAAYAAYATAYAADATAYDYRVSVSKFETLLHADIQHIKRNTLSKLQNDTTAYRNIWQRFMGDLNAVGCGYWARWYEELFKNRFVFDEAEIERRLNVPAEIQAQGAAAVGQYMERLGDEVEKLNEARVIILGEKGAGKTSLARKLMDVHADMPSEEESTEGVVASIWKFPGKDGKDMNAHIWDFAGHSITHSAHRCFMAARCLYIYVYNGRIERDNDPKYWLEQIRIHGGDSPVLFLINEKDGHKADIAWNTLKGAYPAIVGYYSADVGGSEEKMAEFQRTVMSLVRDNLSWNNQVISEQAYRIKNELRALFEDTKASHITRDQFDEIARKHGVSEENRDGVLKDLHDLGICLWYDKNEIQNFNTVVLNPDWIANGIYKLINKGFNAHRHIISVAEGVKMLAADPLYEYPRDKVCYLFELMRTYELAYFKQNARVCVPGILPLDCPAKLPGFDENDRLTMSFTVERALPPNVAARIIVQRHEEIYDEQYLLWRKGVVLENKEHGAVALVIEEARGITVRVKGAGKSAYLQELRQTIQGIFDSYQKIMPTLKYEVLVSERLDDESMLSGKEISRLVSAGVKLPQTVVQYNITNTYINYNPVTNIEVHGCVIQLGELENACDKAAKLLRKEAPEIADGLFDVAELVAAARKESESSKTVEEAKGKLEETEISEQLPAKLSEIFKNIVENGERVKRVTEWLPAIKKAGVALAPLLPKIAEALARLNL